MYRESSPNSLQHPKPIRVFLVHPELKRRSNCVASYLREASQGEVVRVAGARAGRGIDGSRDPS